MELRNRIRTLWQRLLRFIGHHHTIERLVEIARSHAIEGSEVASIFCSFGWFVPLCLYPHYLESSPYLREVGASVPQWLLILVMGSLCAYQVGALFAVPSKEMDSSLHEQIRAARDRARWLRIRAMGLNTSAGVWAFMSYLLSIRALTPTTFIFGLLSVSCLVGNYLLGEVGVKTEADREAFLILTEQADLLPRVHQNPHKTVPM